MPFMILGMIVLFSISFFGYNAWFYGLLPDRLQLHADKAVNTIFTPTLRVEARVAALETKIAMTELGEHEASKVSLDFFKRKAREGIHQGKTYILVTVKSVATETLRTERETKYFWDAYAKRIGDRIDLYTSTWRCNRTDCELYISLN